MSTVADVIAVDSIAAVQEAVRSGTHLLPRGGGSKPALSMPVDGQAVLDLGGLKGMLEYDPGEFVFTALACTPLADLAATLAAHGQYLPFDPPLANRGATLGGTVAAGLSGAGRQRYGGLRDFFIGARFVDGQGRLVRSGGKVVKNAAGFDQHKLLIGSLGSLGILVELSFKVFPQPAAYGTLRLPAPDIAAARTGLTRLAQSRFDVEALDVAGDEEGRMELLIRLGGLAKILPERLEALQAFVGKGKVAKGKRELQLWQAAASFAWLPAGWSLVKAPLTLEQLAALEASLAAAGARRRYSSGGNLAWIGWQGDLGELDRLLAAQQLAGLVVLGPAGRKLLGIRTGANLAARLKQTLDPLGKFPALD
jgi:glycolate oxidase FAD binding subunit